MIKMIKEFLFNIYMKCYAFRGIRKEMSLANNGNSRERDILLLSHALEKGMAMPDYSAGRGKERAEKLDGLLMSSDLSSNNYFVSEGIAALKAYVLRQQEAGLEMRFQSLERNSQKKLAAGTAEISEECFCDNYEKMANFFVSRHSIRNYEKANIDKATIDKIIQIIKTSPSACNRQVSKIYYSYEVLWNNSVGELVPGNKGFENNIHNYFVVTARRDLFGGNEILQWYVNGGIFLGYLSMAIHTVGLGSCIFQWPVANKNDMQLKKLLGVPKTEAVVAIVSYGVPKSSGKILAAARRGSDEIGVECFLK